MFIKKVGYLLLVRLKLFQLLAKISPLVMVFSIFSIYFLIGLKEQYKFQEPSLKTKIFDVAEKIPLRELNFQDIFEGIRTIQIEGILNNQCILITFPAHNEQSSQIKGIYHSLINQKHIAKNAVLMSYSSSTQLKSFFSWYYNPALNHKLSFGVIRVGLNIQIRQEQPTEEDTKDKAYLKLYSSTLHADLDYFQASKELLQKLAIVWSPCEEIHKSSLLKSMKMGLTFIEEFILKQKQLRLFYDHVLCQLTEHISIQTSAHEIMMLNGFQAATIRFILASRQQKVEKFVVSFINEFGMQEDHLHSANTFFYPISKAYFAPQMMTLYPSLIFFTSLTIFLLNQFISQTYKESLGVNFKVILIIYAMLTQYSLIENYTLSFIFVIGIALWSIFQDIFKMLNKEKTIVKQNRIYELSLMAVQGLVGIYFGVFCISLSYLAIFLALIMLLKPKMVGLRLAVKLATIILTFLQLISKQSFWTIFNGLNSFTPQLKLCLMIPILFYSL